MSESKSAFRVIVVGAGVAGLAASQVLQKAGIDHVVLERGSTVAPPAGASIAIYPNGARILHQLGVLKEVQKHTVPPGRWLERLPDGTKIVDSSFFRYLEQNHGFGMLLIERRQFLQELYDNLPDKSYIKTGCPVYNIKQDENGVEVVLENGQVEKGDIVLGCDGVYSSVKSIMWDYANKATPGLITVKEKTAIRADWKCLVLMTSNVPELGERDLTVVHNKNYSHMFTLTPKYGYFFVFFRLDEPCTWPTRPRYTEQDAEDLAKSIANHPMSDTVVFGEVWKYRIRATVVHLEEGVLDHWYHGRIALAGDAVHKVLPNMALGGNSGIESVAVLTNHLRRMLVDNNGMKPSSEALEKALAAYQAERLERMQSIMFFSSFVNKVQGWTSPAYKILSTWILPFLPQRMLADQMSDIIRGAPVLDFVPSKGFPTGKKKWKNEEAGANKGAKSGEAGGDGGYTVGKKRGSPYGSLRYVTAFVALCICFYTARVTPLTLTQLLHYSST